MEIHGGKYNVVLTTRSKILIVVAGIMSADDIADRYAFGCHPMSGWIALPSDTVDRIRNVGIEVFHDAELPYSFNYECLRCCGHHAIYKFSEAQLRDYMERPRPGVMVKKISTHRSMSNDNLAAVLNRWRRTP